MYTLANIDKLERFYHLLGDNYSQRLLIELLKFRILGPQHVRLPLTDEEYWKKYASIDGNFLQERGTFRTDKWYLNRYRLQGLNGPINLHGHPLGVLNTFFLEQYSYQKGARIIHVQPGDVVIDAGLCWGETRLYFADQSGPQGKVYGFEFVQDNLEILRENLRLNTHLANRIEVIPKALLNKSGETVSFCPRGPSTWLEGKKKRKNSLQVSTLSIDDFVSEKGIARVDYIKMDIEGSELKALKGAEKTIRAFRPRVAISLYHREDDFIIIPEYLHKLDLQYEFFVDHFSIHSEETVFFAIPNVN
jgi:FkbM family methyltransferase